MTNVGAFSVPGNIFAQLALPQAQLLTAGSAIPNFALQMLANSYDSMANQAPVVPGTRIPAFLAMPSPATMFPVMQPIAGAGYAMAPANVGGNPYGWLPRLFDPATRGAAAMERALQNDPFARAGFESAIGGRVTNLGDQTGVFQIQPMTVNPYAQRLGGISAFSPVASQLGGLYQQMTQGVVGAPAFATHGFGQIGQSPFFPLALNGFANMANGLLLSPQGFSSFNSGVQGMPLMGLGQASWNPLAQPGLMQGGNAGQEAAHTAQVNSLLNDPSLTMEDKIMLTLMVICQKMDDDIKRQSMYLQQLQNQQSNRNKKGGEKSIDLETKKLERMIQKRSQMFDTLGKIMERYDQSAKNVIQSMRA